VIPVTKEITLQGGLFADADFDFDARLAIGAAACGVGDTGLVLATLDRIVDGDCQSWFDAWCDVASTLADQGHEAARRGHSRTARWALLAAAEYYARALMVIDGLADQSVLLPTFHKHRKCWEAVVDASEGCWVRMDAPYESTSLPGYLLRPDNSGDARPTFVVTNGSDSSLPSMLVHGASEALSRGWNAFLYDGPGQQAMLFERNVPFRYDWEAVLTPVIDALVERPEVDPSALTGYGVSQGGYWITRAVAFEHRMVAAVADPGAVDLSEGWTKHLAPPVRELLQSGQKDAFNAALAKASTNPAVARAFAFRSKPYGASNGFDLFTEVEKYQVRDVVGQITTPLLVLDPEDEQFFPGQPQELYDMLPNEKDILKFTRAQGANFHCQPLNRRFTNTLVLDWLQDHLPAQYK
jgi:hypothetical protein